MGRANASLNQVAGDNKSGDGKSNSCADVGNFFIPDQHVTILRVLAKENDVPAAKMVSNAQNSPTHFGYERILDTGDNDHVIGKSGLMRDSKSYAGARGLYNCLMVALPESPM